MNKPIFAILFVSLALGACSERHENYAHFENIDSKGWAYGKAFEFSTPGVDSLSMHKIDISVRHTAAYPYSNLWLEIILSEGEKQYIDTLEMHLSDTYGRWIGKGFGPTYQMTESLPETYNITDSTKISIRQIMRVDTVREIQQVGITISPAKQ